MGKRHYEPRELMQLMKQKQEESLKAFRTPFTGMATLCNYTLWKNYHFSQSKLAKYNDKFQKYADDIEDGFYTYEDLQKRILEVDEELTIESVDYSEKDNHYKTGSIEHYMRDIEIRHCNQINAESVKYFLIFFNVMIDFGDDKKKLRKKRDKLNEYLESYAYGIPEEGKRIMDLWRELVDGAGIMIEMPEV